jgi:Ca-activated chloride channel family protein
VFLLDVSGSMEDPNKLPLLKESFKLLVNQLREQDKISIVVYAGAAGVVLDSVSGSDKQKILGALDSLQAGGSTAGGQGIQLAYEIAEKNLFKDGNNRVILATDGDFNVGLSSDDALVNLIESKRKTGIYLSVLGFGMGNYKDSRMEKLADKGNGNYAYIDTPDEAKKVLVQQFGGTLFTIAKDVKIQIEFNPAKIKAYRLIGYETRLLKKEDFNDDTKDAGEMGSGHTVTALYEMIPAESPETVGKVDDLKYQESVVKPSNELMTVKLRYKKPKEDASILLSKVLNQEDLKDKPSSENFMFATAVAEFGQLIRKSKFKGNGTYQQVLDLAGDSIGADLQGYRKEFVELVNKAMALDKAK